MQSAGMGIDASLARGDVRLGVGVDRLYGIENLGGTDGADTLTDDHHANVLRAYGGNAVLSGGCGDDILIGGSGNDTYLFQRGDGVDHLINQDSVAGNIDVLRFGSDIASDQLWFRQVGNDLEIDVMGSADKTIIDNWYAGSANQIERIRLDDGTTLAGNDVDKLVQAMASFGVPPAATTALPSDYRTALAPVLAANWH